MKRGRGRGARWEAREQGRGKQRGVGKTAYSEEVWKLGVEKARKGRLKSLEVAGLEEMAGTTSQVAKL